jgi:hypothetical protein
LNQTCAKAHIVLAPLIVVLGTVSNSPESKVACKNVSFVFGTFPPLTGVNVCVRVSNVPFTRSTYENPVPSGWSMYNMLTCLFHDISLRVVELESGFMEQGKPFVPSKEDEPGPPPM